MNVKLLLTELGHRLANKGTITAIVAYIIAQLMTHNVIHSAQLASSLQDTINGILNVLVLAGFLHNPSKTQKALVTLEPEQPQAAQPQPEQPEQPDAQSNQK